jgi:hypothetical protein
VLRNVLIIVRQDVLFLRFVINVMLDIQVKIALQLVALPKIAMQDARFQMFVIAVIKDGQASIALIELITKQLARVLFHNSNLQMVSLL